MGSLSERWYGRSFLTWCESDPEDDRKICYTLEDGTGKEPTRNFSSEDEIDGRIMLLIRSSTIEELELVNNEYHVHLLF